MPARRTLTMTSPPSASLAVCTCAIDAAASGWMSIRAKISLIGRPSPRSISRMASSAGNGATWSCNDCSAATYSSGIISRRKLAAFASAFLRQDADWLLDAAIDLGVLGGAMDRSAFRRGLAAIIGDYAMLPVQEWSLAEAFLHVTRLGQAQNVFVPYDLIVLMRTMFLAEHVVRVLDPKFELLPSLQKNGAEALKEALEQSDWKSTLDRLKLDAVTAAHDLPAVLGSWTRRLSREGEGLGFSVRVQGLDGLEQHLDRSNNRVALALVTLGLYIAGSLLMQHSIGPRLYDDVPILAALAYGLALWFTLRLIRAITRSGRL